jgi:hypothetical protein
VQSWTRPPPFVPEGGYPIVGSHFISTFVDAVLGRHELDDLSTILSTMTFVLEKEIAEIHASAGSSSNQEQPRRRKKKNLEHEQRPAVQVTLAAMRGRVFWR